MKIGIVGVGVVGGATAKVFREMHEIYLYDKYKPEYNNKSNLSELVKNAEVIFISVPTPMKPNGAIDYSAIHNSIELLLEEFKNQNKDPGKTLITIRSTAVSGTSDQLAEKYPFKFAFNPEFLREKSSLEDMKNTDRVVIGANDEQSKSLLLGIYKPLFPKAKYFVLDRKTAEMVKYAANVFLASQVSLANEIYNICQAMGIDYDEVKNTVLFDDRIAKNINVPGHDGDFGFGGKCFPKDINALIYLAKENGYNPKILEEVWKLNEKVRKNKDWLDIPGATSGNNKFEKTEMTKRNKK